MQEAMRQRDQGYLERKRELRYLHLKLAHIKGLVTKYDEMQLRTSRNGGGSVAVE